jgi:AraC family transcriptional regulator
VTRLQPRTFFGDTKRRLQTDSFEYADRIALVPDREVPRHTHTDAHFVLVLRGTYITEAGDTPGLCGPGTLIFNPAGTSHRDRFRTDLGRFFTISLGPELTARFGNDPATTIPVPGLVLAANRAHGELLRETALSELVLEDLGLELVARLLRTNVPHDRQPPRWLLRVRDSIHDRCTEKVTIRELAAEADVHPIHLARTFRRYFDCSPGEYLRRCRIEKVRVLLATTDTPLADLSFQAGFNDQSQLTNVFRRLIGVPPGEYRRSFSS